MNEAIDAALIRQIQLPQHELELILVDKTRPAAERIAAKLILASLSEEGLDALKILTDRVGGKAVARNLNASVDKQEEATARALASLLGGKSRPQIGGK